MNLYNKKDLKSYGYIFKKKKEKIYLILKKEKKNKYIHITKWKRYLRYNLQILIETFSKQIIFKCLWMLYVPISEQVNRSNEEFKFLSIYYSIMGYFLVNLSLI